MKSKVLIVPSNTDLNRGDQALTWESIEIVKSVFGNEVDIFLYKSKKYQSNEQNVNWQTEKLGYAFLTRLLSHPKRNDKNTNVQFAPLLFLKWGLRAIYDALVTMMLLSKSRFLNRLSFGVLTVEQKRSYELFKDIDIVFVKGGGFLHSYGRFFDPYVMYFQLFDVFLAKRMKKDVFVLPNSVGPLKNKWARKIVVTALSKCNLVFVRESKSHQFLKKLKINTILSPDLGFYLKPTERSFKDYLHQKNILISEKFTVAITLRPYRFDGHSNSEVLYNQYINQMTMVVDELVNKNCEVVLVAHTIGPSAHENDTIPLLEIYEKHKQSPNVFYLFDEELNCRDIEKIYSHFDLVIGTRFHSVIFSLNVKTPAIAIAYGGYKAIGIMRDMKLEKFVIPIEKPDASEVISMVDEIQQTISNYKNKIDNYRAILIKERKALVKSIQEKLS